MALNTKAAGAWRNQNLAYVKVGGAWRDVLNIYTRVSGAWRPLWAYSWNTGNFGKCSDACDGGSQYRGVTCRRSDGLTLPDSFCLAGGAGAKPAASASCNTQACLTSYCRMLHGVDRVCYVFGASKNYVGQDPTQVRDNDGYVAGARYSGENIAAAGYGYGDCSSTSALMTGCTVLNTCSSCLLESLVGGGALLYDQYFYSNYGPTCAGEFSSGSSYGYGYITVNAVSCFSGLYY